MIFRIEASAKENKPSSWIELCTINLQDDATRLQQKSKEMNSKMADSQKNDQIVQFAPPIVKLQFQQSFISEREQIEKKITDQKDKLMQKWLREFVGQYLRSEILNMHCPHTLQYWDWFFGYYPLKPEFASNSFSANQRLPKFGWYECIFFLQDRVFIEALHTWWEKKYQYRKHPLFRKADVHFVFYYHNPPSQGLGAEKTYLAIPRLSNHITKHACHPSSHQCFSSKALEKHYIPNDEFMIKRPKYPNLHFFISHYTDFFAPKVFMVEHYTPFDSYIKKPVYCIGNGFNIFKEHSEWKKMVQKRYRENRNKYHEKFIRRGMLTPPRRNSIPLPPQIPQELTKSLTKKALQQNKQIVKREEKYFQQAYRNNLKREGQQNVREILEFGADLEGEKLMRMKVRKIVNQAFMEQKRILFSKIKEKVKHSYESERKAGPESRESKQEKRGQLCQQVASELKENLAALYKKYNTGGRWKELRMEELLYSQEPEVQKRKRII